MRSSIHLFSVSAYQAIFLALCVLFLVVVSSGASIGIDSADIIQVFDSDEFNTVTQVMSNVAAGDYDPRGFYNYGYLLNNLVIAMSDMIALSGREVSEFGVALSLRWISIVSWLVIVWATLQISKAAYGGSSVALPALLLLIFSDRFVYYSYHIHPDLPQAALVTLSIYATLLGKTRLASLVVSGLVLGLAVGTKYSGIFAVPFFAIYWTLVSFGSLRSVGDWLVLMRDGLAFALCIVITFFATNPYILLNFSEFRADVAYEAAHVAYGDGRSEVGSGLLWFDMLAGELGVAAVSLLAVMFFVATVSAASKLRKLRAREGISVEVAVPAALAITVILCMAYLMLEVHLRRPRYLFHLYPMFVLVASYGTVLLAQSPLVGRAISVLLPAAAMVVGASMLDRSASVSFLASERKLNSTTVAVGKLLRENFPSETRVFYGVYSYLPTNYFKNSVRQYRVPDPDLAVFDIYVLNASAPGRFAWPKAGTKFLDGDLEIGFFDGAESQYDILQRIIASDEFSVFFEREGIVVLVRRT